MTSHTTGENNAWNFITKCAKQAGTAVKNTAVTAKNKWDDSSTATKAVIVGSGVAITAPLAIIPVLGVAGFTSAGVAAGSVAASMQTGATAAGSFFALCQSAGATGAVAASTSMGVGVGAGATAGGITAAIHRLLGRNSNDNNNQQPPADEEEIVVEENAEEHVVEQENIEQFVASDEAILNIEQAALIS